MPVDDIAELVDRWRSADGRVATAQAATELARALGTLAAEDRLVLARGLADLGVTGLASDVVARADRGWSRIELTNATRQLLSLDAGSLDGLVAGLGDPGTVEDLRSRVHEAAAAVTGADDDLDLSDVDLSATGFALPRLNVDDLPPPGDGAPGADLPPPTPAGVPEDGPVTTAGVGRGRDHAARDDRHVRDTEERTADVHGTASVQGAASPRERLREVRAMAGRDLDDQRLRAVLAAVPDGWQRRRAALRLIQGGGVREVDAGAVLGGLAGPGDRVAVAGALIRAGLATADAVAPALPPAAAGRLRRRIGHARGA